MEERMVFDWFISIVKTDGINEVVSNVMPCGTVGTCKQRVFIYLRPKLCVFLWKSTFEASYVGGNRIKLIVLLRD